MATNRAVIFVGPGRVAVQHREFPKLIGPNGRKCDHGVIIKLVTTNICGSDLHIYRGRFPASLGMILGHEMTGEVVEVGAHVEFIKKGDFCSVPFNVACGRCRSCKERHTEVCLNVNPQADCGAYGFELGGWQGGQADYALIPYADWNLLKFPDRDQAMAKIRDLTLLSDVLPTGFHGCVSAGVRPGSTVYIAGAGPVGRCAAASARLLGASCILVGDTNQERLALVKNAGYEGVDRSRETPLPDQIEAILGQRQVDCAVDCVGFEAHGQGPAAPSDPAAVINDLFQVIRAGGGLGIPGLYAEGDPQARSAAEKRGTLPLDFGKVWLKSPVLTAGQTPVMRYNRELMMAVLWGRMDYLSAVANVEFIPLESAPEAYRLFAQGSPKKFVIDPHGSVKKTA